MEKLPMKPMIPPLIKSFGLVLIGLALGATGIYLGATDDAPGAACIGIALMIVMLVLAWRTTRSRSPITKGDQKP